ncbi:MULTISPECIES: hypothetical protein [Nocardiopsis]|uniref:Uncharacterized protein n=1 Tax=Nocardiopsis sinuspersici TaxID=501010 RepID=A0A1V3C1Q4_9ACTN|nr:MULTISPECIES: hypothetical protein [Nocardiopsis]NYH50782.1 hypothetical protein [Nocardiopsis sinuspersici]OOC54623.1 hypothetical protein NOSIN_13050 [Nocardiopsis sinuspersici]
MDPQETDPEEQAEALAEQTLRSTRERLAALDSAPTTEHVAVFDTLHQELSGVLGALDQDANTSR